MPNSKSGWAARPPSAQSRDRSRAARKERNEFLQRNPECRICLAEGRGMVRADEVDHIKPLHQGGADTDSNRQSLCSECHKRKSVTERGWIRKLRPTIGLDGWPID